MPFNPAFSKLYCTLKSEPPAGRNAAALSTGRSFKAGRMKNYRDKYLSSRARFERNGSGSAKQALRKASGREKRHVEQINDEISKSIIEDTAAATFLVRSIAGLIAEWFFKDSNR